MSDQTMSSDTIGIIAAILTVGCISTGDPRCQPEGAVTIFKNVYNQLLTQQVHMLQRRSVSLVDPEGMSKHKSMLLPGRVERSTVTAPEAARETPYLLGSNKTKGCQHVRENTQSVLSLADQRTIGKPQHNPP